MFVEEILMTHRVEKALSHATIQCIYENKLFKLEMETSTNMMWGQLEWDWKSREVAESQIRNHGSSGSTSPQIKCKISGLNDRTSQFLF